MGLISTLIYTSELILCSPFVFLVLRGTTFICILTFSSPRFTTLIVPDFLCPTSQLSRQNNGRSNPEVVGSIPTEVKTFFFASCGSLIPFTRANAQWVIHGFN